MKNGTNGATVTLNQIAKTLVPPGIDADLAWRIAVSGAIVGLYVAAIAAAGGLASVGISGYASAKDVKDLTEEVKDVRASLLAEKIDGVTTSLCMMLVDRRLVDYRRDLQEQFHKINGRYHESPSCEILVKLANR